MPWMIEVFRRADRSWQFSYRTEYGEAAVKAAAEMRNAQDPVHLYSYEWFDERSYQEKLTSDAPDQPKDWGYKNWRWVDREQNFTMRPPDVTADIEKIDLGGS